MGENDGKHGTFTLADIKALRMLAVALGVVLCAMLVVARDTPTMLVAVGLILVMAVVIPLAIFVLRKSRSGKNPGS